MPIRRPCLGYPGHRCSRLVERGTRCEECQRAKYQHRNATRPRFERELYSSAAWQALRDDVLADAIACHWCGRMGVKLTGDHIAKVRDRPDLALDPDNVVPACLSCQRRRVDQPDPRKWRP